MSKEQHGGEEEGGGGHSVGLWYVSFSDMITLLLSFFVMLATFSSYSKEAVNRFMGACAYAAAYATVLGRAGNSVAGTDRYAERAKEGSEKPTENTIKESSFPRPPNWTPDSSAYRQQKLFRLASNELFWGKGTALTFLGKERLDLIAQFVKKLPCQIVVTEKTPDGKGAFSLERAWVVVDYFARQQSIPAEQLAVSADDDRSAGAGPDTAVVEILLLAKGAFQ